MGAPKGILSEPLTNHKLNVIPFLCNLTRHGSSPWMYDAVPPSPPWVENDLLPTPEVVFSMVALAENPLLLLLNLIVIPSSELLIFENITPPCSPASGSTQQNMSKSPEKSSILVVPSLRNLFGI